MNKERRIDIKEQRRIYMINKVQELLINTLKQFDKKVSKIKDS